MKNLNIPYEVVLIYFNQGTELFPKIVNKKNLTKPLRKKIYDDIKITSFYKNRNKAVEDKDISEVTISNSGFHVSLVENSIFGGEFNNIRYDDGGPKVAVKLQNDELDTKFPGRNIYAYINIDDFVRTLQDIRYISDGNLHGTFSLGVGTYPALELIKEDSTSKSFTRSTEIGKLISTKPKTTCWKPGWVYALSPTELVLYLGSYIEPNSLKPYVYSGRYDRTSEIFINLFDQYWLDSVENREIHLCVKIDKEHDILEELSGKNKNIKNFLRDYFSENLKDANSIRDNLSRKIVSLKKTVKKGTEIEQLLTGVDDSYNPKDAIIEVIESFSYADSIDFQGLSSKTLVDLRHLDGHYLGVFGIDLKYFLGNYPKLREFYIERLLEGDNAEYKRNLSYSIVVLIEKRH